jgi:CarD family transcriptional regulator
MFNVGDLIIYGTNGVCKVDDIGTLNISGSSKDRLYYTLSPVYLKGSKLFTPVDNNKVVFRPILSMVEALQLIDTINDVETLLIPDEKQRNDIFNTAYKSCDCTLLIKIIKTLNHKNLSRKEEGKKNVASDERNLQLAEDILYGELAISLGMDKENVLDFINQRLA